MWIQKTDGWWQFYLQAGAYTIPALATPFLDTGNTVTDFYGALPTAYLKLVPGKNTSILIGELPTLIGAEYTFDFENMNIERGLLWNQENAISRGIQLNQTMGKFTASVSWNDGFYSKRFTWLTGSLTYTNGPHALSVVAGGNYDKTAFQTLATPVQNNGSIYNVIYTYTKGPWIIQPYFQYTDVPTNTKHRHHERGPHDGRSDIAESRLQTRLLARGTRGIYLEHGERRSEICQFDVRSGQRGRIGHCDAHFSICRLLLSRRPWLG